MLRFKAFTGLEIIREEINERERERSRRLRLESARLDSIRHDYGLWVKSNLKRHGVEKVYRRYQVEAPK